MHKIFGLALVGILSINAFAQNPSQKDLPRDFDIDGIRTFLMHQQSPETKILESFINTTDEMLSNQASTYDQALAGLGFLELGDQNGAKGVLSFFKAKWSDLGLCNFYNTENGSCGIEETVHLGPNMWIASLALQYGQKTGDARFNNLAEKIAFWSIELNHNNGGISMGPVADWGGDWPNVYSSENNIVAFAVFRALYNHENNQTYREIYSQQMQGIINFINEVTLQRSTDGKIINVSVGYNPEEGISSISSCDVVTMLLLVFNPQELQQFFSIDESDLLEFAKDNFFVCVDGICGYDFTSESSTILIGRQRMISLEWTAQMAQAEIAVAQFYQINSPHEERAADYFKESDQLLSEIDKTIINYQEMCFYPYATKAAEQPFTFAPWWKTPQGDPEFCGALSSTLWRLFAYKEFNPLDLR